MNNPIRTQNELTALERLMMAALAATEERREHALRVLQGEELMSTNTEPGPEPYLKLKEVASKLGISGCSLWRWQIPKHTLGGRARYKLSEVTAYLESPEYSTLMERLKRERRAQCAGHV